MRFQKVGAFLKHVKQSFPDHLAAAYLVTGKDPQQRQEAVKALVGAFKEKNDPFACVKLEAASLSKDQLLSEVNSFSIFNEKRLVFIHGAESLPKALLSSIENYLVDPSSSICLLIEGQSLPKSLIDRAEEHGVILEIAVEKPWEKEKRLGQFADQYVKGKYKALEPEAKACLLDWTGMDKALLQKELDKLILYVGEKQKIERQDVFALCSYQGQDNVWQLIDAVVAGQELKALRKLRFLYAEGIASHSLLSQLRSQLQMMLKLAEAKDQQTFQAVVKEHPFLRGSLLDKNREAVRQFGGSRMLKGALIACFDTDLAMRQGSDNPDYQVEMLISKLATRLLPA